jgi:hypothetical protein
MSHLTHLRGSQVDRNWKNKKRAFAAYVRTVHLCTYAQLCEFVFVLVIPVDTYEQGSIITCVEYPVVSSFV